MPGTEAVVDEATLRVVVAGEAEADLALFAALEGGSVVRVPSAVDAADVALAGACEAVVIADTPGGEALRFIAAVAAHAEAPPVILLLETSDPAEAGRAGAAACIPRSMATPELLACVVRHAVAAAAPRGAEKPARCAALDEAGWAWDLDTDAVLWTDAFPGAFGYAPHQVGSRHQWWEERVHPDDRAPVLAGLRAAVERGDPLWSALYRFRRADGSYVQVLDRGRALRDQAGRTVRLVGAMRALAQDARAHRRLQRPDECGQLLDLVREAVVVETAGCVAYANAAAAVMLGVGHANELLGRPLAGLLHPDRREQATARLHAVATGSRGVPGPERLLRADGGAVDVEVTAGPVEYAGAPSLLIVARDIRGRLRLEEQLRLAQRMEAVGRLAGGVAHDFNNLLTTIKGNADLLAMDLPDSSQSREDVEEIQAATNRAAALTRQLLAFGRGQVLLPRVLDFNAALISLLPMLRSVVPENVQIVTELDPSIAAVHADPAQLEEVLTNLALNARDAMPDGGTLTLSTSNTQVAETDPRPAYMAAGAYVRLDVSDTGHGMDPTTREQVFEPFFTTRETGRGAGLGLATVYGIVKQSGGYITVESEPGRGTTFHILLPRVTDDEAAADPVVEESEPATARGNVLLVEDEDPVRRVTARALRRRGFGVLEACDGVEALELWERHADEVDMVLTDLVMPRMGGEELAQRLKAARPALPLLFMTGYTRVASLSRAALGPDAEVVHKPFDADVLADRIARMLEKG